MFSVGLVSLRVLLNCFTGHDTAAELEISASALFRAQPLAVSAGECLSAVAGALSLLFNSFGLRFTSCMTNILFVA